MGTAAYMSPEQARGEPVDGRSDLFSLGAVLYEMVTGRPAFSGDTASAILRAILNDTPPSPRAFNPRVPAALENVVMRLLAKDPGARHQQASAVRSELQRLASELDAGSYRWLRRWRRRGGAAAAIVLVGIAIWVARRPAPGAPVEREYTQITHFADSVTSPAVSSDGRLLTFIRGASTFHGRGEIYIKALPDGEPKQLTSDGLAKMSPSFSPDNSTIAYTTVTSQFGWDTWTVPVGGGEARRWLQNASGLSWLRDGRLMFSEQTGGLHMKVTTADEQRNAAQVLYSPAGEYRDGSSIGRLTGRCHGCSSPRWTTPCGSPAGSCRPPVKTLEDASDPMGNAPPRRGHLMASGCISPRTAPVPSTSGDSGSRTEHPSSSRMGRPRKKALRRIRMDDRF